MIILGIDPGSRKTGYAVLKIERNETAVLKYGTIILTDLDSMPNKLVRIFNEVEKLFDEFSIGSVAVEAGFYGKNAQSAYKLGYARSAAVLASALKRIEVVEYSPRKVKQAVTGNGNASKSQVKYMVMSLLHLTGKEQMREDEADACAIAICHSQNCHNGTAKYRSWKDFVEHNKHLVARPNVRTIAR
ncbi:MAG: crossover junction endodeoxyribonuclease RuvC [Candidatus Kryptoniota bacterium]